jgi:hypothetical protein
LMRLFNIDLEMAWYAAADIGLSRSVAVPA